MSCLYLKILVRQNYETYPINKIVLDNSIVIEYLNLISEI
ncbi:hypothetical protein BXY64_0258 [Marinifilum flexuosum]|uniref:Uncharacterized protein n=1 Tax=Marinifilum flexuosum TaxID=1117708 RepID=A0A419X6E4_9BACT|nr:hypothetical protein BXY64_0258 [Marinifilum flexuosum]